MTDLPRIPGHAVVRLLGQGGMGVVYLAQDLTLGRRVAVKVVSQARAADPAARARFLREARVMATVEHPHVVRVYSFGEVDNSAYLIMEYVEGESLSDRLRRGRLEVGEALDLTRQVVEGLAAAWEHQLVHRDIKPSNILLDDKGRAHVADFGLAKPLTDIDGDASLTASGTVLGTAHYLSPEQARGHAVDFRSDVYSLGVVVWEMLAGRRPFEGSTPMEVVSRHLSEGIPRLSAIRPDLPAPVVDIVAAMTAPDPAQRPASFGELSARLTTAATGVVTVPTPTAHTRRRLVAALLVNALLLAIAGIFLYRARPIPAPSADTRLRVAVAPFWGPDEDSAKEGRLMAALVERSIRARLRSADVVVLSLDQTSQRVRDHDAARGVGRRLGANVVVWGEAFAVRGETQIQPYLTLVSDTPVGGADARRAALDELRGGATVVGASAPDQIALRQRGAEGMGDMVLVLAGLHALHGGNAAKALAILDQAPTTAEVLCHRAEALDELGRADEARAALENAVRREPADAAAWGALGDERLRAGDRAGALEAYARAAPGRPATRDGLLHQGRLYTRETYRSFAPEQGTINEDTGYLLGLDPATGRVQERQHLPGALLSLREVAAGLEVRWREGPGDAAVEAGAVLAGGHWSRPLVPGSSLRIRRNSASSGQMLAENFLPKQVGESFAPRGERPDVPRTLPELERALRQERERDPTQPWHAMMLGEALWAQGGRHAEAETLFAEALGCPCPAIPYSDYAWMATIFEELGQPSWADRAYAVALARRRVLPQAIGPNTLIERLVLARFSFRLPRVVVDFRHDLDRGHVWLERARELSGASEFDDIPAAAWAVYFRSRGDAAAASREQAFLSEARANPLNFGVYCLSLDRVLALWLATVVASWVLLLAALRTARRRPRGSRGLSRGERRVVLIATCLSLVAFAVLALQVQVTSDLSTLPIGIMDSLGGDAVRAQLDRREPGAQTAPLRFLRGVAAHLAGDRSQAEELYASVSDRRALRNLEDLKAGRMPAEPALAGDFYRAVTTHRWATWLSVPVRTVNNMVDLGLLDSWPRGLLLAGLPLFQVLLTVLLGLVPVVSPSKRAPWRRLVLAVVGSWLACALALGVACSYGGKLWVPGPISQRAIPLTTLDALPPTSWWKLSLSLAGASVHWTSVVVAALVLAALPALRRRDTSRVTTDGETDETLSRGVRSPGHRHLR